MDGGHENVDMRFGQEQEHGSTLNCPSPGLSTNSQAYKVAGIALNSLSMSGPSDGQGADPLLGSGWDPLVSLSQNQSEFSASYPVASGNQGMANASLLVQYCTSESGFTELVPKLPEMVGCFGLPGCSVLADNGYRPQYNKKKEIGIESDSLNGMHLSQEQRPAHNEEITRFALNENKRKRESDPNFSSNPNTNAEGEALNDSCVKSRKVKELEENFRNEQQPTSAVHGKQIAKPDEVDPHNGEAPKENFVHVRARRGQATNSHSLAERVRREKISERMRLLQELVPGCNKITGKAVMLDEIINYVQSLQQQVEFLSMKLATVNPEMNLDIERILSKDISHSRMVSGAMFGVGVGVNGSVPYAHESFQGNLAAIPTPQFPLPPPAIGDPEYQSVLQVGYDSTAAIDNSGSNRDG